MRQQAELADDLRQRDRHEDPNGLEHARAEHQAFAAAKDLAHKHLRRGRRGRVSKVLVTASLMAEARTVALASATPTAGPARQRLLADPGILLQLR
ncbi:hypothetical protein [Streptomyces sp. NPDC005336]|uniref:hypothetical protein n=2 Tax=unclassified Streptomyces TaxID=2593676 RepID=UPI0033BD62BA